MQKQRIIYSIRNADLDRQRQLLLKPWGRVFVLSAEATATIEFFFVGPARLDASVEDAQLSLRPSAVEMVRVTMDDGAGATVELGGMS